MENEVKPYDAQKYPDFKEYLWFKANKEELMARYNGRYIVIKDEKIIADYGSFRVAWQITVRDHKPGTFIIHQCMEPDPRRTPRLGSVWVQVQRLSVQRLQIIST